MVIGNVGTLQANIPLLPDAVPDDGLIDAVVLAPRRISQWPRLALSLVVKSMREQPRRAVHREADPGQGGEDGPTAAGRRQIADGRTLSASVDPSALVVRVP